MGKKVIFLPQCHSTNDYLMGIARQGDVSEGAVVWTDHQTGGRGQRGNSWVSESGQNVLASILIKPFWLPLTQQYLLTVYTAVAIREGLQGVSDLSLKIKWPNDIYLNDKKLAGILCESSITGQLMDSAVLGFGINVNQGHFLLPLASSLKIETGQSFDREVVLESILLSLEKWYHELKAGRMESLMENYYQHLLGLKEKMDFESKEAEFSGIIQGLDERGRLKVKIQAAGTSKYQAGTITVFDIKEIRMII